MLKKPFKLTIIEDQIDMIEVVEMIIEQHFADQFEVTSFSNCHKALDHILKNGSDIVITDINMPEMHGDSIFRQVREQNQRVQFIYLSGDARKTLMVNAFSEGVRFFVTKPFKLDDLTTILSNCLFELEHWYNRLHFK